MSRTPTDEEISFKAVAFDKRHFADGVDPAPERIAENHKRLKDDPKLLTRLVPRFISALAFFEGYKQATIDIPTFDERSTREVLLLVQNKLEKVSANQDGWSMRYHVLRAFDEIVLSLNERDPTTADEEMRRQLVDALENVKALSIIERNGLIERLNDLTNRSVSIRNAILGKLNDLTNRIAMIRSTDYDPCAFIFKLVKETTAEVARLTMNDPKNIGIVIKPPPPPPVVDPYVWEGLSYFGAECRVDRAGNVEHRKEGCEWKPAVESLLQQCRLIAFEALVVQIDASEKENVGIREQAMQSEAERLAMKEERDRALGQLRAWEARTGETELRIVQAKLEKDKPIANDELRTGIGDELAQAAAKYANERQETKAQESDAYCAKLAILDPIKSVDRSLSWCFSARAFVYGARWQSARMENAAGEDPPNVHELREENERLKQKLAGFEITEDERMKSKLAWLNSLDGEQASRDRTPLPSAIVFRDDNERDYWDSVSHILAKKQETTAQSVASGADELVEERRLRNPLAKQVRDELRDTESDGHRYTALLLDGKLRVTHYGQTTEYDVENDERFKGKPAKKIAWIVRHELRDREQTPSSVEFANRVRDDLRNHNEGIPGFDVAVCYPNDTTEEIIVWLGQDWHRFPMNPARCSGKTPEHVAQEIRDEVCSNVAMVGKYIEGKDKPQSTEPSDELLLKAAQSANRQLGKSDLSDYREIECAREAAVKNRQSLLQWDLVVRAFVDASLAK